MASRNRPGYSSAYQKKRRAVDPAFCATIARNKRKTKLKLKYGLTQEEYTAHLERCCHACELCKKPFTERRVAIDHIHGTRTTRGILCRQCNCALGMAQENPELLRAMAGYIEDRTGGVR